MPTVVYDAQLFGRIHVQFDHCCREFLTAGSLQDRGATGSIRTAVRMDGRGFIEKEELVMVGSMRLESRRDRHAVMCWCTWAALVAVLGLESATPGRAATPVSAQQAVPAPHPYATNLPLPQHGVLVEILEGIPDKPSWDFALPLAVEHYVEPAFAFVETPFKYSEKGLRIERSNPFLLRVTGLVELPAGKHQFLLRSRSAARLFMDGRLILETPFQHVNGSAHGRITDRSKIKESNLRPLRTGDSENVTVLEVIGGANGTTHRFRLEVFVGGQKKRQEVGETLVAHRQADSVADPLRGSDQALAERVPHNEPFRVLSPVVNVPLTDADWLKFIETRLTAMAERNAENRKRVSVAESKYWERRHELAREIIEHKPAPAVPTLNDESSVYNDIDRFIDHRLQEAGLQPAPLTDDWAFLRRVCLDVIGTIPSPQQIDEFIHDTRPDRRSRLIDRLLEHPGWADNWVGYWQDVLAENPNIVKPTLNNTGPFRWWIHESFEDNKPFDRFATELILMEGSKYLGAPAGFGMATQNDAPMAAKAYVIGRAFLGLEMKCARCHDAPFHDFKQKDLFSLAAMLKRGPQPVPKTSSVPLSEEALASLIVQVTLKPGTKVAPQWPFDNLTPDTIPDGVLLKPNDPRERLAALVTSPDDQRFARVIVNRLWQRYMGRGLVEPLDDWQSAETSHPQLLDYLVREFVRHGYDLKYVARLILNSHTYQRQAISEANLPAGKPYLFAGPLRRRMSAEQVLDSLFAAAGKKFNAGALNMDLDGTRPYSQFLNLGEPERAWEFASLSNERDRPSLSFPFAQDFISMLKAFGWRASRQNPITVREQDPTVLQPAILANGVVARRITRLSDDSALTELALEHQPAEQLVARVFQRLLTRPPTPQERDMFVALLRDGYEDREIDVDPSQVQRHFRRPTGISWSNHFDPQANRIKIEMERLVEQGDPPSVRLQADWCERLEDMIWALINTPEFVFVP